MNIKRVTLLASMALTAIAFAAPAIAQANVFLTEPAGTKLAAGAKVTMTSTNMRFTLGESMITCAKVTFHYEVVTNGPTHVVLKPLNTPSLFDNGNSESCVVDTLFGSFPATVTNLGTKDLTLNTWGTGPTSSTFTTSVPLLGLECSYTGNLHFQGTHGTSILHAKGALGAPSCASGEIHGTFNIETTNSTAVFIDAVTTPGTP